jgi:hypothetical protein
MRNAAEKLRKGQLVHIELRRLCIEQLRDVLTQNRAANQCRIWTEIDDGAPSAKGRPQHKPRIAADQSTQALPSLAALGLPVPILSGAPIKVILC